MFGDTRYAGVFHGDVVEIVAHELTTADFAAVRELQNDARGGSMSITTSTGICAAIVAVTAVVAAAQAPASQNNSANSSADNTKTVVTGCLKEAPSSATDTAADAARGAPPAAAPSASAANANSKFVLENATATGASADAANKGGPQTYQLIANGSALAPHAGKKLELTGTLEPSSGSNSPSLKVESGKIVAASCSQ